VGNVFNVGELILMPHSLASTMKTSVPKKILFFGLSITSFLLTALPSQAVSKVLVSYPYSLLRNNKVMTTELFDAFRILGAVFFWFPAILLVGSVLLVARNRGNAGS
jgi:cytochrome bd-type quinol oxidase subunit 2